MSANTAVRLERWTTSQKEEDAMFKGHFQLWQIMIDALEEKNFLNRDILDFGCNQGGFLRMLYNRHPFRSAVGADIAMDSLRRAGEMSPGLPVEFVSPDVLSSRPSSFDIAFSHEVIYLLPDLAAHARRMYDLLRPGGVYYAATGCHTENPLWPQWRKLIQGYSNIPVPDYSINDYVSAFAERGFSVSAKPFAPRGFVTMDEGDSDYYPSLADKIRYYHQHKMLFRFSKD